MKSPLRVIAEVEIVTLIHEVYVGGGGGSSLPKVDAIERRDQPQSTKIFAGDHGANAVMAALDTAGFVIVPKEPTEDMYAAAEREWDGRMSARSRGVWQAMIAAAQQQDTPKS